MTQFLFVTGDRLQLTNTVGLVVAAAELPWAAPILEQLLRAEELERTWSVVDAEALFLGAIDEVASGIAFSTTRLAMVLTSLAGETEQVLALYAGVDGAVDRCTSVAAFLCVVEAQLFAPMNEVTVQLRSR